MARFSESEMALKNSGIDLSKACVMLPERAEDILLARMAGESLADIGERFISSQLTVRGVIDLSIAQLLKEQ